MAFNGPTVLVAVFDLGESVIAVAPDQYDEARRLGVHRYSIAYRKSDIVVDRPVLVKHNVQYEPAEHDDPRSRPQMPR